MTIGTDTLAQDTFNRANGNLNGSTMSDAVNTWTTVSGTCSVASNKETGAGVARVTSNSGIGNANYSVQAEQYMKGDVSIASDGVDGILTLFARYVDSNNFYYATIQCTASNYEPLYYNIGKVVSGSHTSLTSGQEDDTGGTTWRFDADGTSLKLFKGGSQVLSTTDSAITGTGYPALSSGARTGVGGAAFLNDNFIVKGTAVGGGTEVAITGQAITSAQGSLGKTLSKALVGQGVTSAQGTLSPLKSVTLGGIEIASAQGDLSKTLDIALTGIGIASAQGTVNPDTGDFAALTGIGIASGQGSLGITLEIALTGIEITSAQGSVAIGSNSSLTNPSATGITYSGWTATVDYSP